MSVAEDVEEGVLGTTYPKLRLLQGGKGPPLEPPSGGDNWLSALELRTQFACRQNDKTVDWEMYFLFHKFSDIFLLKWEMPTGQIMERRVDPKLFSNMFRDYRVIAVLPITEAPEGDKDEPRYDPDGDRSD